MKFQVPQFIEIEDKIFGPLSFKEFIYLLGGAGLCFLIYRFIPSLFISIIFIIPVAVFAIALAFYRPNNKPFIEMVQSALLYFFSNKLYLWKKKELPPTTLLEHTGDDDTDVLISLPNSTNNSLSNTSFDITTGAVKKEKNGGLNLKI